MAEPEGVENKREDQSLSSTSNSPVPTENAPKEGAIKSKLLGLAKRFDGFEQHLDRQKKKKKEDADKRVVELQTQIHELQTALELEKRNQTAAVTALKEWFSTTIKELRVSIETPIKERLISIEQRVRVVEEGLPRLEEMVVEERKVFPAMIDKRAKELLEEIQTFKTRFAQGQRAREQREEDIQASIVEQGNKFQKQLEAERMIREQRVRAVAEELELETRARSKAHEVVQRKLTTEFTQIKLDIEEEKTVRSAADEELVQAIKHYTAALQDSIKLVSEQ